MSEKMTPLHEVLRTVLAPIIAELRADAERCARDGATVDGAKVNARIAESLEKATGGHGSGSVAPPPLALVTAPTSWRERLWTCPDETRLGVREVAEALGRPRSWCYRHTSKRSGLPLLPCRRLDGDLVFVASELREWIRSHEDVVVKPLPSVFPLKRGA
jgi:predicted DNA-binding transcriptional regulator AlpA